MWISDLNMPNIKRCKSCILSCRRFFPGNVDGMDVWAGAKITMNHFSECGRTLANLTRKNVTPCVPDLYIVFPSHSKYTMTNCPPDTDFVYCSYISVFHGVAYNRSSVVFTDVVNERMEDGHFVEVKRRRSSCSGNKK